MPRKLTPVINIRQKASAAPATAYARLPPSSLRSPAQRPVLSVVARFAAALHFAVIKVNLPETLDNALLSLSACVCVWVCVYA